MIISANRIQGSAEWLQDRLGVLTASQIDKLLTPKLRLSAQRQTLLAKLIAEKLLSEPVEDFGGNYWTDRGKVLEQEAGAYFSLLTGLKHEAVGIVYRDDDKTCGCSPDGLVASDAGEIVAGLELKCPSAIQHMQYVLDEKAEKYKPQVQYSIWVTGLPCWYFMSYYPGLPPLLKRVFPLPEYQDAYSEHVPAFIEEMREAMERI